MPGETVSTIDAILKEVYAKPIQYILDNKIRARQLFSKQQGSWEGRRVRYPVHLGRNQGVGATSEGGTLPRARNMTVVETQIPIRYNHGRIQLTIQTIKHSRSNKGAFDRAMTMSMKDLTQSIARNMNRQMWGWGVGILCYVNGDPGTGTTITVDTPGGVAGATHGNRFLNNGMDIAFVNPSDGAIRAGGARTINAVPATDGTTFAISLAADGAVADNDYVVRASTDVSAVIGDTSYNNEVMGLLGLVDDTTYLTTLHNISRSTYPIWRSTVVSSVGALSADILQRGLDVADQIAEGSINCLLSHHSVMRAYQTITESDRRYMGGDLSKPDAGTSRAKQKDGVFGGIDWKVDKDAPYGLLFGLDLSNFTRWVESEGEWADDDGTILMRVQDVDAYEARYRLFENYSNDLPGACVRWDGIDATTVVAHSE